MKRSAAMMFLSILIAGTALVPANALARHRHRHRHRAKATVTWSMSRTASEGSPIPFSWTTRHLGRHYRLVVQRPFGTVHVWRSIMRLRTRSGSAELPGYKLGIRRFRIAAFRGRKLLTKQASRVKIFGTVPFTTLLENEHPEVYTAPSHSFSYVGKWEVDQRETRALFGVSNNNCSSVHIAFVPGNHEEAGAGTVTVVQESRDPVPGSASFDSVGSVDVQLIPGQTWGVNASIAGGYWADFYINGYAICYSTVPFSE